MTFITKIVGNSYKDHRGIVSFVNNFDMTFVKRFYQIYHTDIEIIRAWQGHKNESKWFYCSQGGFIINCVQPLIWKNNEDREVVEFLELRSELPSILHVPKGYVTGFKAVVPHSKLIVYSDFTLSESESDDFRFPVNTWLFKCIK